MMALKAMPINCKKCYCNFRDDPDINTILK